MLCSLAPVQGHRSPEAEARCPECGPQSSTRSTWVERRPDPFGSSRSGERRVPASPMKIALDHGLRYPEASWLVRNLSDLGNTFQSRSAESDTPHWWCQLLSRAADQVLDGAADRDLADSISGSLSIRGLGRDFADSLGSSIAVAIRGASSEVETRKQAAAGMRVLAFIGCSNVQSCPAYA